MIYQVHKKKKRFNFDFLKNSNYTTKLIVINVLLIPIYYLAVFGIVPFDFFALKPSNIFEGKYLWTFLTSMFMHGGMFHLFVNMISLYFVGTLIEKILGRKRYLRFYLAAGLFAGFLFVLTAYLGLENPAIPAVGASGALFGLVGLLILLTPNLPVYAMFIPIPIKMKYAAPGMLILLWLISLGTGAPIGNIAHLGGLVAGLGYGLILKYKFPNKVRYIQRHFR